MSSGTLAVKSSLCLICTCGFVGLVSGGLGSSGAGAENRNHVHTNQAPSFTKTQWPTVLVTPPHYSYTI